MRTAPYFVETVLPSTSGSRSRWTPSRETSAPIRSLRRETLSISSRNTIPFCSTSSTARDLRSSSLMSFPASSSVSSLNASRIRSRRVRVRPPPRFWNMLWSWLVISSIPGGAMISTPIAGAFSSTSISRSSSLPSRSILRNFCRVDAASTPSSPPAPIEATPARAGRSRMSRIRSSAASSARRRTFSISRSRLSFTATSVRSRTMDSTSRPT